MGRSPSSLCDEIRLNSVRGTYDPAKANHKAYVRRKYSKYQGMRIVGSSVLRAEVTKRLMDDQSPEAVAGYISRHRKDLPPISKDSVYRFMRSPYGRQIEIYRWLRRQRHKPRRSKIKSLPNRIFIDKRSKKINTRSRIGDTEADFIVSGKSGRGILLVVVDRKSREVFIERITCPTIPNVHAAFVGIKNRFSEMRTITMDNDILFAKHEELAKLLNVRIYFCHPYHSWEKGTVENVNKIIRRDIPKGSDISRYSKRFVELLEAKLNRRPMKCLGYKTPQEVINGYRKTKKRAC